MVTIKRKLKASIFKKINNQEINEESFTERVYSLIKQIPWGRVSTYRDIAHKLNIKAYRAVGQALKRNPFSPKVPCHRIVSSSGNIGGYKGNKIKEKIKLLEKEGVKIRNNKVEDFEKVLYKFK